MLFLSVSLHVFLFFDSLYLSICLLTKSVPFFCPRHCCVFIVFLFFLSICPHPAWLSLSLAVFVPLSLSLSLPLCLNLVFLLSITVNLCVMFVFLSSLGFFPSLSPSQFVLTLVLAAVTYQSSSASLLAGDKPTFAETIKTQTLTADHLWATLG